MTADFRLLRKNEGDEVEAVFGPDGPYDLNFIRVNAQQRFYDKLDYGIPNSKPALRTSSLNNKRSGSMISLKST